jgi:hypothetical protein
VSVRPCDRCSSLTKLEHLYREDDGGDGSTSPALCLVCVHPDFYRYDDDVPQGELPL